MSRPKLFLVRAPMEDVVVEGMHRVREYIEQLYSEPGAPEEDIVRVFPLTSYTDVGVRRVTEIKVDLKGLGLDPLEVIG